MFIGALFTLLLGLHGPALAGTEVDPAPVTTTVHVSREGGSPYRLVGSGDSILQLVLPYLTTPSRFVVTEPCRAPWSVGCDLRAATVTEVQWAVGHSRPGGFVLVQDGGRGDRLGRITTDSQWRAFVQRIADIVPNDRMVLFVYPGSAQSAVARDEAVRRSGIIYTTMQASGQPWRAINWRDAVARNPGYLSSDGLHPSPAGARWLAGQVAWLTR